VGCAHSGCVCVRGKSGLQGVGKRVCNVFKEGTLRGGGRQSFLVDLFEGIGMVLGPGGDKSGMVQRRVLSERRWPTGGG